MHPPTLSTRPELPLLYEDEHLLVFDKPAGLGQLEVLGAARDLRGTGIPVHRLDRWASGTLVLAREPAVARSLGRAFRRRRATIDYLAVVEGELGASSGVLDFPLAPGREVLQRVRQGVELEEAARALTRFAVRGRAVGLTLLELRPLTGSWLKIRGHLQELGHPIAGRGSRERHLRVHAATLRLEHPASARWLQVEAPLPADMAALMPEPSPVAG